MRFLSDRRVLALVSLSTAVAVIGISAWLTDSPKPSAAKPVRPLSCEDPIGSGVTRAGSIAAIFVTSTVVSVNGKRSPECSYDFVTSELREGKDREGWVNANPVPAFPVDYRESVESGLVEGTEVVVEPKRVTAILFVSGVRDRALVYEEFLVRLVKRDGWRVEFWGVSVEPGGFGPPAQTE
jgi:hypothetical protein